MSQFFSRYIDPIQSSTTTKKNHPHHTPIGPNPPTSIMVYEVPVCGQKLTMMIYLSKKIMRAYNSMEVPRCMFSILSAEFFR